MSPSLRLLGVYAHPDDESFGNGGTLAKYAREDVEVHVCIATDGAVGTVDPELLRSHSTVAELRAAELDAAVSELRGVLHRLPYRDSGMIGSADNGHAASLFRAPLDDVAHELLALFKSIQPQVIITHDPTGGYGHPDHIKVNSAVTRAWELWVSEGVAEGLGSSGNVAPRLFWSVIPIGFLRYLIPVLRLLRRDPARFGANADIDLTRIGVEQRLITTRIDVRNYLDVKERASRFHISQGGGAGFAWSRLPRILRDPLFGSEAFVQAYPTAPLFRRDLFEGLRARH